MAVNPPPGVDLQADRGPDIIRSTVAVAVSATMAVIARLISRRLVKANWNGSDYTVVLGLVGCWALNAVTILSVSYGFGKHVEVVPLKNMTKIIQILFAAEIMWCITFAVIKISILLLYRSLFPGRWFAVATNIVGSIIIAWCIAIVLVSIFSCKPIHGFWDITVPSVCINTRSFFIGNSIPNVCADVFILALPLKQVWHLKVSLKSRILVSGLFLLGGFVCIISAVRFYFLLTLDSTDSSWSYYDTIVWSIVEVNVAVISACLPTLRPLLQTVGHIVKSLASSVSGSVSRGRAVVAFKITRSKTSSTSTQQEKAAFQQLPEYPFDHMSALQPAKLRGLGSVVGKPDLESGDLDVHGA